MNIVEEIAAHAFFADLPSAMVQLVAGCGRNQRFQAGELIFRQDEPADHFYLIRHGQVAVELHGAGHGTVQIQSLHEGDVLGWSWLFPPYRWQMDARAVQLCRTVQFDGGCLRRKCDDDPVLGYELMKRFARIATQRFQQARMQLLDLYAAPDA